MVTKLLLLTTFIIPTKEDVWSEIKNSGVKHPKVVFAQAVIESGGFKSVLAKSCNNLFGMRIPKKRPTLAVNRCKNKLGFATFDSWQESVYDYLLYQKYILRNKEKMTDEQYLRHIAKTYASNPQYVTLIINTMKRYSKLTI
jgi:uncharacterized FlgJ-related protein